MDFNLSGLLLSLAVVQVFAEAKTYTKPICKTSDLGKDDQVTVERENVLIAQFFCHKGNCSNAPNTVGQLTEQSGYLVLTIQNISPLDRFDAYKRDESGKTTLLKNFTLDEDEALNTSITQTVPPTSTTHLPKEANTQRNSQTEPHTLHATKAFWVVLGALGFSVLIVSALIVKCEIAGQDGRWKVIIAFPRKRSVPNQHDKNSMEMQSLAVPV